VRIVLFFAALLLPLVAAPVHAQLVTAREHERQLDSGRAAVTTDVNTFFGRALDAGYFFLQPTVIGAVRYRELVLEAALPFAFANENDDAGADGARFVLGHPWAGLAYLPDCDCGLSRLSLGIAVDAAPAGSALAERVRALARGAMGDWDGYLFREGLLPLVLGASTRMELGRAARLSWDGDVALGLPAGARTFELGTQHAVELTLLFSWHWQLGTRLHASYYPTLPGDDFQSAASLYLRYVIIKDAVGARFLTNLDGPAGFAFSRAGMWGLGVFYSTAL